MGQQLRPRRWYQRAIAVALVFYSLLVVLSTARVAHADGGAPNLAYVAGAGNAGTSVAIIDLAKQQVTGTIDVSEKPAGLVLSTDAHYAYIVQSIAHQVAIADAQQKKIIAQVSTGLTPRAIAIDVSSGTTLLYVANSGDNSLSIISPDKRQSLATISVGEQPVSVAIAGAGSGIANVVDPEVYVANEAGASVSILSTQRRQIVATVALTTHPVAIVVPASGGVAYVATQEGTVEAIHLISHRLLGTVVTIPDAHFGTMDYDAITGQIYLPDATNHVVHILAPVSLPTNGSLRVPQEPIHTITTMRNPTAVAITFDGTIGAVAEQNSGNLLLFDATNRQTLANIAVGGTPVAVIMGSYPPLLNSQAASIIGFGIVGAVVLIVIGTAIFFERRYRREKRMLSTNAP